MKFAFLKVIYSNIFLNIYAYFPLEINFIDGTISCFGPARTRFLRGRDEKVSLQL